MDKKIIYIMVYILFISFAYAFPYEDTVLIDDFDDATIDTDIWNVTEYGTCTYACYVNEENGLLNIMSDTQHANGRAETIATKTKTYYNATWVIDTGYQEGSNRYISFGLSHLYNYTDLNGELNALWISQYNNGYYVNVYGIDHASAGLLQLYKNQDDTYLAQNSSTINNCGIQCIENITMIMNTSGVYVYVNGTLSLHSSDTSEIEPSFIWWNAGAYDQRQSSVNVTEVHVFGTTASTPEPSTIYLNITHPFEDEHLNKNFMINATTNVTVDCSINSSDYDLNFDNGTYFSWGNNTALTDGYYSIWVNCSNGSLYTNTTRNFYVDLSSPTISTTFTNGTIYYDNNITANFNLSDNIILYAYNISIDGTSIESLQDIDTTFYQVNFSHSVSSLTTGIHYLELRVSDGHTKNKINDYNVGIDKNKLTFSFDKGYKEGWVSITSENNLDSWDTTRERSKYSFEYTPYLKEEINSFIVESSFDVHIVEAEWTKYKKWIIIDDHWLDFYSEDSNVEIIRISDKKVSVEVTKEGEAKAITFNSIGDLNIVTRNYSFSVVNITEGHVASVMEQSTNPFYTNVTHNGAVSSVTGYITYNNTNYTATASTFSTYTTLSTSIQAPTVGSNTEVSFIWYIDVDGTSLNISGNQTVINLALDNCSTYKDLVINLTQRDENTLEKILPTILEVEVIITNLISLNNYTYYDSTNLSSLPVCITTNASDFLNGSYKVDIIAGYEATNYVKEFWFLDNGTINGSGYFNSYTPTSINLYDLPTTDSSTFLFSFTDENGLEIENAIIHTYRKYIGDGTFREVERSSQDDNGETHVHLIEEDVIYYFMVTQEGVIKYISSTYNAKCLSDPCSIELKASRTFVPFPEYEGLNGSQFSISTNKTTRESTLSYVSNASHLINYTIYSFNGNLTYINSSTLTGVQGSITLKIPISYGNQTYIGAIYQDGELVRSEWLDFKFSGRDYFGSAGAIMGGFIVMALGLMAISEGVLLIISVCAVLLLLSILAFVDIGWFAVISIICAGGIIIWSVIKKKNG